MASNPSVFTMGSKPPRGSKKACNFCKRRHLKCDGLEPSCSHCEHRNIECVYVPSPSQTDNAGDETDQGGDLTALNANANANGVAELWERPTKMAKLSASTASDSTFELTISPFQTPQDQLVVSQGAASISSDWSSPDPLVVNDIYSRSPFFSQPDFLAPPPLAATTMSAAPPFLLPQYSRAPQQHRRSLDYSASSSPLSYPLLPIHGSGQGPDIIVHPVAPGPSPNHLTAEVMIAFGRNIKPIFSGDFTMTEAEDLQRFIVSQSAKFAAYDTRTLIKIFLECTMVAHGCRHCGNSQMGNTYANKSYAVMVYLLRSRSRNDGDFSSQIQNIVSGMELLAYYCIGSDDMIHARQAISEAYRLASLFKTRIAPVTYHRILALHVSSSVRDSDALDFLFKSRAVPLDPDNPAIASGYIMLAMGLVGRHFAHGDLSHIVPSNDPTTPEAATILQEALNVVAQAEEIVNRLERSQSRVPNPQIQLLVSVYRSVIDASRGVILWKLGQNAEAAAAAAKVIHMGRASPVAKLMYLISYATSLQILRYLGYVDIFQQGLANLEQEAPMYELVQRFCADLRQPIRLYEEDVVDEKKPIVRGGLDSVYQGAYDSPASPFNSSTPYPSSSVSEAPDTPIYDTAYRGHAPTYYLDARSKCSETQSASSSSQLSPVTPEPSMYAGAGGETYAPVYAPSQTPQPPPISGYGFDFVPHGSYSVPNSSMQSIPPEVLHSGATPNQRFDSRFWDANL